MEFTEAEFDAAMSEGQPVELELRRSRPLCSVVLIDAVGVADMRGNRPTNRATTIIGAAEPIAQ